MAFCIKCGKPYNQKRANLGYPTCLGCGQTDAQKEIERKSKQVAPAYNKGPLMFITSADKDYLKGLGGKGEE